MSGRMTLCALCVCSTLAGAPSSARAQVCGDVPQVLILLDRSGSMAGTINGQTKWSIARQAVNNLTASFSGQLDFGLMLFPGTASICAAGSVNVACNPKSAQTIRSVLQAAFPRGNTPIGSTLNSAAIYLQSLGLNKPRTVILVTDGEETCGGDPSGVIASIKASSIDTYVIGFGANVNPSALQAMASAGGTATYHQANNLVQLSGSLQQIAKKVSCCGNGVLDSGETCDTAINAGIPGACPVSCDDNDACTKDSKLGKACAASCSHQTITQAIHGDGCCPSGATIGTDRDCPAVCGDGVVSAGESCDTAIAKSFPGSCVRRCNDHDPCTKDAQIGAGCQSKCQNLPITQFISGDGCCPKGATDRTDSDCPRQCGNGTIDAGEKCDTAIAAGNSGACPQSCDDGNACTKDLLRGTNCLSSCAHTTIVAHQNGDGCCPAGANAITDSDCPAKCGNGALEKGETCDTAIPAGKAGACPVSCPNQDACVSSRLVGAGCGARCEKKAIAPNLAGKDGCCPKRQSSRTDADCPPPCGPDRTRNCVDLCAGVTCKDGQYCSFGSCAAWPEGKRGPGGTTDPDPSSDDPQRAEDGDQGFIADEGCACSSGGSRGPLAPIIGLSLLAIWARRRRTSPA